MDRMLFAMIERVEGSKMGILEGKGSEKVAWVFQCCKLSRNPLDVIQKPLDITLSHFVTLPSTIPILTTYLPFRPANLTLSPSIAFVPPSPFLFLGTRRFRLSFSLSLLFFPPLPPPALPLAIQAFGLPPRSLLFLFTDDPRFIEHVLLKRGVLGPGGDFFVCGADDGFMGF